MFIELAPRSVASTPFKLIVPEFAAISNTYAFYFAVIGTIVSFKRCKGMLG